MSFELENALRYRNYAEELRIIASDRSTPEDRQALLTVAKNYDQLAVSIEAIDRSKKAKGLSPR